MKNRLIRDSTFSLSGFGAISMLFCSMVGIGNIWSFPYVIGSNAGGAFLILYFFILMVIGVPYIVCALSIGRHSEKSVIASYDILSSESGWRYAGLISILACIFIVPSYSQLGGALLFYLLKFASGSFPASEAQQIESTFQSMLVPSFGTMLRQNIFIILSCIAVSFGVKSVWQSICKISAIAIVACFGSLLAYSSALEGFKGAAAFMLFPRWDMLSGESLKAAFNYCIFSLNLGLGIIISIGAHLKKSQQIFKTSLAAIALDTLASIVAGIVIFSLILSSTGKIGGGAGIIFLEIIKSFSALGKGSLWGMVFFIALNVAIITSSAALMDSLIFSVMDILNASRKKASAVTCIFMCAFSSACNIAIPIMKLPSGISYATSKIVFFFSEGLFIFTAAFALIVFSGWCIDPLIIEKELGKTQMKRKYMPLFFFTLKFISPALMLFVFLLKTGFISL